MTEETESFALTGGPYIDGFRLANNISIMAEAIIQDRLCLPSNLT
jgi:hypothetical protein